MKIVFSNNFLFQGAKTIIHPGVSIIAEAGPIFIGDGNLIEEQCVIENRFDDRPLKFSILCLFSID